MELVRLKGISKRTKHPIVLTADQCMELISLIPDPYRTMVYVAICTGLRVSEIVALRWSRIDFDRLTMTVRVKAVNGRIGRVKTECSEDELPLDPDFAAVLRRWKDQCRETPGALASRPREPLTLLLVQRQPRSTPPDADSVLQRVLVILKLGTKPLMHDPDLVGVGEGQLDRKRGLAVRFE
jgi:integrase